jgi:hypothetical protein
MALGYDKQVFFLLFAGNILAQSDIASVEKGFRSPRVLLGKGVNPPLY